MLPHLAPRWIGPLGAECVLVAASILLNDKSAVILLIFGTFLIAMWGARMVKERRDEAPPRPRPALRLSTSPLSAMRAPGWPNANDKEDAKNQGRKAVEVYSTVIDLRETAGVRAENVSVRIAGANPPGNVSFPVPIGRGADSPLEFNMTPAGVVHIELLRCVKLDDGTLDVSAPLAVGWLGGGAVELDLEALIGDEVADARRFRVEDFFTPLPGLPLHGTNPWPTVTEIGPVP